MKLSEIDRTRKVCLVLGMAKSSIITTCIGSVVLYLASAMSCATPPSGTSLFDPESGGAASVTTEIPDAAAEPITGNRLRPVTRKASDGSVEQTGLWWDAPLGVMCRFVESGKHSFCLPAKPSIRVLGEYHRLANCSDEPVDYAYDTGCSDPVLYVVDQAAGNDGCSAATVFSVYAMTEQLYVKADGGCVLFDVPSGQRWYFVGAEVSLTEFVSASLVHD